MNEIDRGRPKQEKFVPFVAHRPVISRHRELLVSYSGSLRHQRSAVLYVAGTVVLVHFDIVEYCLNVVFGKLSWTAAASQNYVLVMIAS